MIPFFRILFLKNLGDASCNLVNTQTVRETTMFSTMKGVTGCPELLDTAQALKFFGID